MAPRVVLQLIAIVLVSSLVSGQSTAPPLPDAATLAAVDAVYPGAEEILRLRDPRALARLAGVLTMHPSPESMTMLLWMLRYTHRDGTPADSQLLNVARVVRDVPIAPIADAWRTGDQETRETAIVLLSNIGQFRSPEDQALRERTLIAALSDSSRRVREFAASALRAIGSAEAKAALARAATGLDVDSSVYEAATGQPLPALRPLPDLSMLSPALVAVFSEAEPEFRTTLANADDHSGVRRLVEALARRSDPDTTAALTWLFAYLHPDGYAERISYLLSNTPHVERVSLTALIPSLTSDLSRRRASVATLIDRILLTRRTAPSPAELTALSSALIARLADRTPEVRSAAANALGHLRGDEAVPALLTTLGEPSARSPFAVVAIQALAAIGNRTALPALERWARSDTNVTIRSEALRAIVAITKPSDPGAEARRLLWEQPDMAWETEVINGGRPALPRAWRALASNDEREQRAAAAVLGWLPDTGSIAPILDALARAPGAIMRQQLTFDLQMILLETGMPVDVREQLQLASEHLHFLFESSVNNPFDGDLRRLFRRTTAIAVHPYATTSPLSVLLEAETAGNGADERPGRFTARTQRLATAQLFREAVDDGAIGVAFHPMLQSNGVALVATTLTFRNYGSGPVWISVYRREAGNWTRIRVPAAPFPGEPTNLMPPINRNYGANHPMRVVRLVNRMQEIERTGEMSGRLEDLDADLQNGYRQALDASVLPLLEPYRQSKVLSVQYTAELHTISLGAAPNLPFWMKALERDPADEVFRSAVGVVGRYAKQQIASEAVTVSDRDRQQLIAAMQAPVSVNPSLRPQVPPSPGDVDDIRRSERFALIQVRFGRGVPKGDSGYTMLFERRNDAWVFLCTIDNWMS
ncbi:MAG TPA: HEAT repeat domain-containing protein [Vicinamibacterales bacterium]